MFHVARHVLASPSPRCALLIPLAVACTAAPSDPGCNGLETLCAKRLDEVRFAMTHNAMSSAEEGWVAPNQTHAIPTQLADGIRGFMLDTHYTEEGSTALCHGFCELGSTPLVDGLRIFHDFLEGHPREVIVFMIQNGISSADTVEAFEAAELDRYTYAHDPATPWPTLGELIARDTRLVVFHEGGGTEPAWYMDGYASYVWDTDYRATTVDDFGCDLLRGSPSNALFLVNHFLTAPLPLPSLATEANERSVLRDRVTRCESEAGRIVNWLAVDFYEIGSLLEVVDELNAAP